MMNRQDRFAALPHALRTLFCLLSVLLLATGCGSDDDESNPSSSNNNTTPTQLTKANWQIDLTYAGGDFRVEAQLDQSGGTLSGDYFYASGGTNFDVNTSGTISGTNIDVTFTLDQGTGNEASFRCTGTITSGSPQTLSGNFTSTTNPGVVCGGTTPCQGTFAMQ